MSGPLNADDYMGLVAACSALETQEQDEDEASADSVNADRALHKVWALLSDADKAAVRKVMGL